MADIAVDVWLYGSSGTPRRQGSPRKLRQRKVRLPEGSTMADLLAQLGMRTEERGITFINGQLSAMPGLQPDLGHIFYKRRPRGPF